MHSIRLSPAQRQAKNELADLLPKGKVFGLVAPYGCGRTSILQQIAEENKGLLIRLADIFQPQEILHPLQVEENLAKVFTQALDQNDLVVVDDFYIVQNAMYSYCYELARPKLFEFVMDVIYSKLEKSNKKIVLGLKWKDLQRPLHGQCFYVEAPDFNQEDFSFLFPRLGGKALQKLDYAQVFRFARRLNIYQMQKVCHYVKDAKPLSTKAFLQLLEEKTLISNVRRQNVRPVKLENLYGVDDVIRQLEIDLITPLERPDLAEKLGAAPKRGVLLYGPPGTGKTTIGRALARRLRSKFFLIDGTVIDGSRNFYHAIEDIFEQAKANAPSILFIDDSDLLFHGNNHYGLYRYLLTMLDGLATESNAQITVFFTAMDVAGLPPALIRSGRVELWLKMKLPDKKARRAILKSLLKNGPLKLKKGKIKRLAQLTAGLTGADLRRLRTDAVNAYAYDMASGKKEKLHRYFETAVKTLLDKRKELREATKEVKELQVLI